MDELALASRQCVGADEALVEVEERMNCIHCGGGVNPERLGVWREVTGWVQQRDAGGAHGVYDQKPTGKYACETCMALIRRGISVDQGSLL